MKVLLLTQKWELSNYKSKFGRFPLASFIDAILKSNKVIRNSLALFLFCLFGFNLQAQNCPINAGTDLNDVANLLFGLDDPNDCILGDLVTVTHEGGQTIYIVDNCTPFGRAFYVGGPIIPPDTPITGSVEFAQLGLTCEYSTGAPFSGEFTDLCTCLDNEIPNGPPGQFSSQYTVSSGPGETWIVTDPVNVYSNLVVNPAPPAAVVAGTVVNETPINVFSSNYIFTFIHLDGQDFSFTLENVTNPGISFDVVSPQPACSYPNAEVDGDAFVCPGETAVYTVVDIPQASYQWSLSGGGTIDGPDDDSSVTVDWDDQDGGPHNLEVTVNTLQGCSETADIDVVIEDVIPLACNNNINLSMDANCEVQLTPDMVLEDPQYEEDSYSIQLRDIAADTLVPNGIIHGTYVGVLLEVKITHDCSGNSCWGLITVEDKTVPELLCDDVTIHCSESTDPSNTGLPLPDDTNVVDNGDGTWTVLDFDACGESVLSYYDNVTNLNCEGPFAAVVVRTWVLTDGSGSTASCVQSIYSELADLDDLGLPGNYDGTQNDPLNCADKDEDGGWISLPNGHPSPETTGYPQGPTCLNLIVDYTDQLVEKCGDASFVIIREWTIWDVCTNDYKEHKQTIKVLDLEGPLCAAPNEFDVYTNPGECTVDIDVPAPTVIFDCSDWTYTVKYKLRDESGNPFLFPIDDNVVYHGSGYTILDVPFESDSVWIIYYLIDECNNTTECFTEVALHDLEEPVAICDQHTVVSVGDDGCGYANVWAFDDGSWDNCAFDYMEARRMEDESCGIVNGWGQTVKFCCDDIGNTVMIQLQVYDKFGNSNSCMVEVEVQDSRPPIVDSCPNDVTVDCGTDLSGDLSQYGTATFIDNCDVTVTTNVSSNINDCGIGEVYRTFTGTDPSGLTAQCVQTIYVRELDPFYINQQDPEDPTDDVDWPRDITVYGCVDLGTSPDELPSGFDRPVYYETECSMVAMDYDDLVFQFVEDACYKILRQWTIVDWCQFDQFNPAGGGIWYHTQVIKVQDSNPPELLDRVCDDITLSGTPVGACSASIHLDAWANDDCTEEIDFDWIYTIDLYNDGTLDDAGNTNNASGTYPYGTHKITWTVIDLCDNESSCSQLVTIEDKKAPTPICIGEIATVVMPSTGTVTVWASDFLKEAVDNCSDEFDIEVSFSEDINDKFKTFTCEHLEGAASKTFEIQIYLTDEAGNQDYCTVELSVQDNNNSCLSVGGDGTAQISGAVYTEMNVMIDDVEISLHANMPEFPIAQMSEEGYYAFSELFMYEDYMVQPWKDDSPLLGVSTLDLVLIQKHILGITPFDSPYKIIASDANNSETISAVDLVQLRKLILGLIEELPANDSWRFVDAGYEFADPSNPFPFTESIEFNEIDEDVDAADFIAVKIGDVNETVSENYGASTIRTDNRVSLLLEDGKFETSQLLKYNFTLESEAAIAGYQMSLAFDNSLLEYKGIESAGMDMDEQNLGLQDLENGLIHISVSSAMAKNIQTGESLMTIHFLAKSAGQYSESIELDNRFVQAEIYTENETKLNTAGLKIEFRSKDGSIIDSAFELYQNVPNPFTNQTTIGFKLPESANVNLTLYDVTGRILQENNGYYQAGYNEFTLDLSHLNYTGILYYQIETEAHSANKKMILIK